MPANPSGQTPRDEQPRLVSEDATRFVSAQDAELPEDWDFEVEQERSASGQDTGLVGVLGEYLLLEQIGSGGMGQVFRAEHRTMNRQVALKILSKKIAERPNVLQQFFAEIRAVAKLMHPNIVTAFDAGSSGTTHYLVMELVRGQTVSSWVKQRGPLPADEAIGVLRQVAEALGYAHDLGIVHRDIKPGNLMLTEKGVLKILDFGLARLGTQDGVEGNKRFFMGTPEYMSPEQIENADHVDGRSDLYSLGATFFYLLTGQTLFSGEKMQVARAQLREKPRALFEVRHGLDLRLDSVFQRLVAKAPEDRYASAHDLIEHLESLQLCGAKSSGTVFQRGGYRLQTDAPTSVGLGTSTLAKKSQVVAIELGLNNTTAAYFDVDTGPQLIAMDEGHPRYLRNMLWSNGRNIRIGAEAASLRQVDPDKIFHSIQRWIGQPLISRHFGGESVPPEVILGAILKQVMQNAAAVTDESRSAVITVPSCYGQLHRRAIRNACRIAGIELVQLLDKPLAAALSWLDLQYRLMDPRKNAADRKLLVVQLSGTGLDASVIHAFGTTARQLGSCGHWKLGQMRWQHLLVQYFSQVLKEQTGKSIRDDVAAATRLQRTIEIAFGQLTRSRKVEVRFEWEGAAIKQPVTQEGLLKISPDLRESLRQSITSACATARIDLSEIDQVLLGGGMMHMKPIQKIVTEMVPHPVHVSFVEKTELAFGAAIQGHNLSALGGEQHDISPEAVGCAAYDIGLLSQTTPSASPAEQPLQQRPKILIEKGSSLPHAYHRTIRPERCERSGFKLPAMQLIESSSLGRGNWVKLAALDVASVFDSVDESGLQLQLGIDPSGILESFLTRPTDGQRVTFPMAADLELPDQQVERWRQWLDTALLSSDR